MILVSISLLKKIQFQFHNSYQIIDNNLNGALSQFNNISDELTQNTEIKEDTIDDILKLRNLIDSLNLNNTLEDLAILINKIPSFRMRQKKLKYPYNKSQIQVDHSFANVNANQEIN